MLIFLGDLQEKRFTQIRAEKGAQILGKKRKV